VNARDEPHADQRLYRRLHVIVGDANMSEYAAALKVGTTALVLAGFEQGWVPAIVLRDPIMAIKETSQNTKGNWIVELDDGRTMSAIDVQRTYLEAAQARFAHRDEETRWVLREWESVLDALEGDLSQLADRLDWVAKRQLLESFVNAEKLHWRDEALLSLDLEYHNVNPEQGLYYALEQQDAMQRLVTDEEIQRAMQTPPQDTRACIRGECVRKFSKSIEALNWSRLWLKEEEKVVELNLRNAFDQRVDELYEQLSASATVGELVRRIIQK
jgi:proteasome accessory factor A